MTHDGILVSIALGLFGVAAIIGALTGNRIIRAPLLVCGVCTATVAVLLWWLGT